MTTKRKEILQMVEAGKLTVDEALILLDSLDKDPSESSEVKAEDIQNLSTYVVDKEKKKTGNAYQSPQSSIKDKIFSIVDQTVKKVKDKDLDFNFGPSVDIQHIFQQSDVSINDIEIDVSNGGVTFKPWTQNSVRIECEASVYKVANQDEARQAFLQDVLFSINEGTLRFSVQKKQMKVKSVIYIPEVSYNRVQVRLFNGSIEGERLTAREIKSKTAHGAITLTNSKSEGLEVETANGLIHLIDVSAPRCEVETINGAIRMEGEYEKVNVQTFNGNVTCRFRGERTEKVFLKTTTGSIEVIASPTVFVDGDLKSNLGGLTCQIPNMEIIEEKNETVQKHLRFKANSMKSQGFKLFAESKTGSILIKN
ncbi:DUF4097 family beta strand repeat-containing protein [Metabacillus iocasae]|uniref:DUF4097 and DUF4098 domain-containing protein YvlB n=1 Tax=Priestia iocasae TaxID=2291674 RepID=A0ABS2QZ23_9BACI|nr:DUF4097 domain-containing protein [Metabacillus iocasae]MBM7704498.1 DUF4097 and DUF4098 domain-containing protein YvlB [Metabacillus iocasae]